MPQEGMIYALELIACLPYSKDDKVNEGHEQCYRVVEKEFERMYGYKPQIIVKSS